MDKLGRYSADRKKIEALTAAKTVEVADCGTVFTLGTAGGFAVVLPNASDCGAGWWCKFIVKVSPTGGNYTIDASSGDGNNLHGVTAYSSGSIDVASLDLADSTNGTAVDRITIVQNKAKIGDQVELVSDGALWYVTGMTKDPAAVTYD